MLKYATRDINSNLPLLLQNFAYNFQMFGSVGILLYFNIVTFFLVNFSVQVMGKCFVSKLISSKFPDANIYV